MEDEKASKIAIRAEGFPATGNAPTGQKFSKIKAVLDLYFQITQLC